MAKLIICPLSTPSTISIKSLETCNSATRLFAQTKLSPVMLPLSDLSYETMDDLYDSSEDFDELNIAIASRLVDALNKGDVVFAVTGRGASEQMLSSIKKAVEPNHELCVLTGAGYADSVMWPTTPATSRTICEANALPVHIDAKQDIFIEEIDTAIRAGEVKLALLRCFPDEHSVYLARMNEAGEYNVTTLPLYAIDREKNFHATSVLYVPGRPFTERDKHGYFDVSSIVHTLRAPGGCPWDREQTHATLKKNLIEECYEVIEAIDDDNDDALLEELGDVLLQVVFHAEIAREQGRFDEVDVCTAIVEKLKFRHPHIFAEDNAKNSAEVLVKWEQRKKEEKQFKTQTEVLRAVPKSLPALMRAYKLQKKAANVGFDWDSAQGALNKLDEEKAELMCAMKGEGDIADEMGDILFTAVNISRLLGIEPEEALAKASDKFTARFAIMENLAVEKGKILEEMSIYDKEKLWVNAKSTINGEKTCK